MFQVEQQAFARVYRIGQQKETELVRLIVTNTIDAAMMAVKVSLDTSSTFQRHAH